MLGRLTKKSILGAVALGSAGIYPRVQCASQDSKTSEFSGKVVMITGAGGTFGRLGAHHFASLGAKVVAVDMSAKPLQETVETSPGGEIFAVVCDITKTEQIDACVKRVEARYGRIDMLWNNAGYQGAIKPTLEYPVQDFANVMSVNVVGAFAMAQRVAQSMAATGGGVICNTASVAGLRGTPAMPAYASSKAAVITLTVSMAKDLAPYNIRVNAISPALIGPGFMWDRQNELHAASGSPYFSRDPEAVAKGKVAGVPMKRLGTTEEVIKSVAFLLSSESSYCTGINHVIDGGLAAGIH